MTSTQELEERIKVNLYDYDAHRALIEQTVDVRERHERLKRFQALFPLDEASWLAWLDDLAQFGEQVGLDQQEITRWFEASLKDYLSPKLHVLYCRRVSSVSHDLTLIRETWRTSSAKCGSHFTQGHLIWDAWITFEQQQLNVQEGDGGKTLEYAMRRRATTPLEFLETYWQMYSQQFPPESEQYKTLYESAKSQTQERLEYERSIRAARGSDVQENPGSAITAGNPQLEQEWIAYLDHERKQHPKKRAVILLERAINDCCLSKTIWERYITDMELNNALERDVIERGLRNIPSSSGMAWAALVLLSASHPEAKSSLERCRQVMAEIGRRSEALEAHLAYLKLVVTMTLSPFELRKQEFEWALEYYSIEDLNGDVADREARVKLLRLFTKWLIRENQGDDSAFRTSWEEIHRLHPTSALLWMEHQSQLISLLSKPSSTTSTENLSSKAMHHLQGQPEAFEFFSDGQFMDNEILSTEMAGKGDSSSFLKSKRLLDQRVATVKLKHQQQIAKATAKLNASKRSFKSTDDDDGEDREESQVIVNKKKRPKRKSAGEEMDVVVGQGSEGAADLPSSLSHKRPSSSVASATTSSAAIPARKIREHAVKNDPSQVDIVFIPNLPDSATIESLQSFFTRLVKVPGASVKRVQLKTRMNLVNKSTGEPLTRLYAFVEFGGDSIQSRNQAAQAAVKLSGSELDDFPLKILLSNPPASTKSQVFKRVRAAPGDTEMPEANDGIRMDVIKEARGEATGTSSGAASAADRPKPKMLMVPRAVQVATQNKKA